MSFGINPPNRNLSNIQASAKSCPGGGGNTGYFRRDGDSEEDLNLKFASDYPDDSFEKQNTEDIPETLLDIILNFFSNIIEIIKKFFGISEKESDKKSEENNNINQNY